MIPSPHPTKCCSLGQISADNKTSLDELRAMIDLLKEDAYRRKWSPEMSGGQRAVFCVTTPSETVLERNLGALGFVGITTFPRRYGYPEGLLTMWVLSW